MTSFLHRLFGSKPKQARSTPRHKRGTLRSFEVLEDRRLTVVGAFANAPPTGVGTWVDGVVGLKIEGTTRQGSGALLADGRHVLTAAHCLQEMGLKFDAIHVVFDLPGGPVSMTVPKSNYRIHENYNSVTKENDIAILVLPQAVPAAAPRYDLYTAGDELGQTFLMVGYGQTGNGATGATAASGTRRYGYNRIDNPSTSLLTFDFDNPSTNSTAVPNESNLCLAIQAVQSSSATGLRASCDPATATRILRSIQIRRRPHLRICRLDRPDHRHPEPGRGSGLEQAARRQQRLARHDRSSR